ncbi:MAG: NAD-binding protein, partial [Bacteroidales bacterium]|nr:NAD-binding protein [Bacteroidales bacterium]
MNIIIAGDGEVGFHLAKMLHDENHDITIVDPHEELLMMLEYHTDIMTSTSDSTSVSALNKARINKADLLISILHDGQINLDSRILGKTLGAKPTIARINNT